MGTEKKMVSTDALFKYIDYPNTLTDNHLTTVLYNSYKDINNMNMVIAKQTGMLKFEKTKWPTVEEMHEYLSFIIVPRIYLKMYRNNE